MLEFKDTCIELDSKEELNHIDLKLQDTGIVNIIGDKSKDNFIKALLGKGNIFSGDIFFNDKRIGRSRTKRNKFTREKIATLLPLTKLLDEKTVQDHSNLAISLLKEPNDIFLKDTLSKVELDQSYLSKDIESLSEVEKMKVSLMLVLLKKPSVLIVDGTIIDKEPKKDLYPLLRKISKEILVIYTSKEIEIELTADRIIKIEQGSLKEDVIKSESNIVIDRKPLKKRCHLSVKKLFKLFISPFKKVNSKLILASIFSLLASSLFNLIFTSNSADEAYACIDRAYKDEESSVILTSNSKDTGFFSGTDVIPSSSLTTRSLGDTLTLKQLSILDKYSTLIPLKKIYHIDGIKYMSSKPNNDETYYKVAYERNLISRLLLVDEKNKDALIKKDKRVTVENRLPIDDTEIAINSYQADVLLKFGLNDYGSDLQDDNNLVTYDFASIDEIIGKNILGKKIVGIFENTDDRAKFKKECESIKDTNSISKYRDSFTSYIALPKTLRDSLKDKDEAYAFKYDALFLLSGKKRKDKSLLSKLRETRCNIKGSAKGHIYSFDIKVESKSSDFLRDNSSNFFKENGVIAFFTILAIALEIAFVITYVSFISSYIKQNKDKALYLKNLGLSSGVVFLIDLLQSFLLTFILLLISMIPTGIILSMFNAPISVLLYKINGLSFLFTLLITVLVSFIAALFEVKKYKKI